MVFIDKEDYSDLYGGGRKRKRYLQKKSLSFKVYFETKKRNFRGSFEDYGSDLDEDYSSKKRQIDPNDFDPEEANWRSKVISKEFMKRRTNHSSSSNTDDIDNALAETTFIKEALNKKISNLSIKTRENSFKKILEYLIENRKCCCETFADDDDDKECEKLCIDIEHEIFNKAKNLILYQSNLIKKLSELKRYTKEKKSFIKDYEEKRREEKQNNLLKLQDSSESNQNFLYKEEVKEDVKKGVISNCGFTSAFNIFINKNNEENNEKSETIKVKKEEEDHDSSIILLDNEEEKGVDIKLEKTIENEEEIKEAKIKLEKSFENEETFDNTNTSSSAPVSLIVKKSSNSKTSSKEQALNLQKISKIVVAELTVYYKNGRFVNKVCL